MDSSNPSRCRILVRCVLECDLVRAWNTGSKLGKFEVLVSAIAMQKNQDSIFPEPCSSFNIEASAKSDPLKRDQEILSSTSAMCKPSKESTSAAATVSKAEELFSDATPHSTGVQKVTSQSHLDSGYCQVCRDIAAGFYCGAFVCEACKKFFIRSSKQEKQKFACLHQGTCTITKESRVQCQYCRYQKCLQLNMYYPGEGKRTVNSLSVQGIPCRVCAAPSSGFHFGALTCEGCKGFFRRMVKEREPGSYKCSAGESCEISMHTRNMCKACRYNKCINIGMSVEGSRIGRQPNAVKYSISLEMKQQSMDQLSSSLPTSTAVQKSPPCNIPNSLPSFTKQERAASSMLTDSCTSSLARMETKEDEYSLNLTNMELLEVPAAMKMDIKEEPVEDSEEELLMSSIELASKELLNMCMVDRAKSDACEEAMFETYALLWKKQMKHFKFHAQCVVRFAKKIQGFRGLNLDDQGMLVRNALYPMVVLNHSRYYEMETGFYNYFNFTKLEEERLMAMAPELQRFQDHFTHIGLMTQILNMTHLEYTFLSCLVLFDTECSDLLVVEEVRDLQEHIISIFQNFECKTYPDGLQRFGELLLRMSDLKLIAIQHFQPITAFLTKHPGLETPELFKELYL